MVKGFLLFHKCAHMAYPQRIYKLTSENEVSGKGDGHEPKLEVILYSLSILTIQSLLINVGKSEVVRLPWNLIELKKS